MPLVLEAILLTVAGIALLLAFILVRRGWRSRIFRRRVVPGRDEDAGPSDGQRHRPVLQERGDRVDQRRQPMGDGRVTRRIDGGSLYSATHPGEDRPRLLLEP